jgi:hypothetical protein
MIVMYKIKWLSIYSIWLGWQNRTKYKKKFILLLICIVVKLIYFSKKLYIYITLVYIECWD